MESAKQSAQLTQPRRTHSAKPNKGINFSASSNNRNNPFSVASPRFYFKLKNTKIRKKKMEKKHNRVKKGNSGCEIGSRKRRNLWKLLKKRTWVMCKKKKPLTSTAFFNKRSSSGFHGVIGARAPIFSEPLFLSLPLERCLSQRTRHGSNLKKAWASTLYRKPNELGGQAVNFWNVGNKSALFV